jgi:hypothetical protein
MTEQQPAALLACGATAKTVVDRLISIASGAESSEWLAKYVAVQKALADARFKDAVREHSRLVDLDVQPTWVASRDLATWVGKAIGNLARELKLPNPGESEIPLDDLPTVLEGLGTVAEEESVFASLIKRDPFEDDPAYAEILDEASNQAESALANHPMNGGIGFIHVFWEKKKEILKQEYGLEWRTPAELNPDINFD